MLAQNLFKILPFRGASFSNDEKTFFLPHPYLLLTFKFIKQQTQVTLNILTCIAGVDYLQGNYRFNAAYDFLSSVQNARCRIKFFLNEITALFSGCSIYINSNWWEREIWDLFGLYYKHHLDLRRILTDYGFEGFPLRKDFPLSGFTEVGFQAPQNRVGIEPVTLSQAYRNFEYSSPWSSIHRGLFGGIWSYLYDHLHLDYVFGPILWLIFVILIIFGIICVILTVIFLIQVSLGIILSTFGEKAIPDCLWWLIYEGGREAYIKKFGGKEDHKEPKV
jgi:NADH-quinone oxidoreductase subunit C